MQSMTSKTETNLFQKKEGMGCRCDIVRGGNINDRKKCQSTTIVLLYDLDDLDNLILTQNHDIALEILVLANVRCTEII